MKKYLPYVILTILLLGLTFFIFFDQAKKETKIITINKAQHYLYQENKTFAIPFYINQTKHPFLSQEHISSMKIKNTSETKILDLKLARIHYHHQERYLGETFYQYQYQFELPFLGSTYQIEEAYLEVTLENQAQILLSIGSFSVVVLKKDQEQPFFWEAIHVSKGRMTFDTIGEIDIKYEAISIDILSISVDGKKFLAYDHDQGLGTIKLYINDDQYVIDNVFIQLVYLYKDTEYQMLIENHTYLESYHFLENHQGLVHIYEVSNT